MINIYACVYIYIYMYKYVYIYMYKYIYIHIQNMIQIVMRNFDLLKSCFIQIVISHKESYFVKLIKATSEFESLGLKRLG